MAGRGPRPKDPQRRARQNSDSTPTTLLRFERADQPDLPSLPDRRVKTDGGAECVPDTWGATTLSWWERWGSSPQAEHFSSTDWDFLADTAFLHHALWTWGDQKALPELRLRVAKFGATMEDRARLRMQFAEADEAEAKRAPVGSDARSRFGALTAVPDVKSS